MTRTNDEWASKITGLLDQSVDGLSAHTVEQLAAARRQALVQHRERPAPAWSWAAATNVGSQHAGSESRRYNLRLILVLAALISAVAIALTWQTSNPGSDIADIDASLLSDELPINAYLDKGFDSWVKRGSR